MSEHHLMELIAVAYEAALDETRWPSFLERLAELLDAGTTVLYFQDFKKPWGAVTHVARADPEMARQYEAYTQKSTSGSSEAVSS